MSANKFTQGPWKYCGQNREQCLCGQVWSVASDFQVATAHLLNEENGTEINEEQLKANTRLIAAAPDMLEALLSLHEATCEIEDYNVQFTKGYIDEIREANKKALAVILKATSTK